MDSVASAGFLSSLLDNMDLLTNPYIVSLERTIPIQDSDLLNLPDKALDSIVSFIPLKERALFISPVCRRMRESVNRSITSVAFYKDQLDGLTDIKIKYFLSIYGAQIKSINFDLFRSTTIEECTQWSWRQSVISSVKMCHNLRELNILVCNRHRLRDNDLLAIFRECPQLQVLCVDAQYLNGHCFQMAPVSITRLEMEMCYRISEQAMRCIFMRLRKLTTFHVSQLLILKDSLVSGIVHNLKNLRELSIVSHQDSTYKDLSANGLAQLARLSCLRCLCVEGLSVVTDRFLTEISDESLSSSARTITSLSLAFCFNVSMHGVQRLSRMSSLQNLNLDGITKRDISIGLEKVAKEGRLVRLLLAERTNVSPESLMRIVQYSPNLRLLDITNNESIFNWHSANTLVSYWASMQYPQLAILTNEHLPWNMVYRPKYECGGRVPVNIVHLHRGSVPLDEVMQDSVLSSEEPHQLPPGLLYPCLRRGNRYRLLWEALGPAKERIDSGEEQKENTSPNILSPVPMYNDLAELAASHVKDGSYFGMNRTSVIPATFCPSQPPPPLGSKRNVDFMSASSTCSSKVKSDDKGPGGSSMTPYNPIPPMDSSVLDKPCAYPMLQVPFDVSVPPPLLGQCSPRSSAHLPSGFSFKPISDFDDPHSRDWSMDALTLLMNTHAYRDGARVGPMDCKEGLVFKPDGLVGFEAALDILTSGSAGAPRPPVEIPQQPVFHYTRGPRAKRRSNPPPARAPAANFLASDFPPLSL